MILAGSKMTFTGTVTPSAVLTLVVNNGTTTFAGAMTFAAADTLTLASTNGSTLTLSAANPGIATTVTILSGTLDLTGNGTLGARHRGDGGYRWHARAG